jgi:hypothetical protein
VERVYLSHDLCTHVAHAEQKDEPEKKLEKILNSFSFPGVQYYEYRNLYMLFPGVGATLPGLERRGSSAPPHPSCSCKTLLLNIIIFISTFILHSSFYHQVRQ